MKTTKPKPTEFHIDAAGKTLGRVASQAATYLMGKNRADFARHIVPNVRVTISNANKISITSKKLASTVYKSYSGYQGGLTIESLEMLRKRRGMKEGVKRAVLGMIPRTKIRPEMMKHLTVTD